MLICLFFSNCRRTGVLLTYFFLGYLYGTLPKKYWLPNNIHDNIKVTHCVGISHCSINIFEPLIWWNVLCHQGCRWTERVILNNIIIFLYALHLFIVLHFGITCYKWAFYILFSLMAIIPRCIMKRLKYFMNWIPQ